MGIGIWNLGFGIWAGSVEADADAESRLRILGFGDLGWGFGWRAERRRDVATHPAGEMLSEEFAGI